MMNGQRNSFNVGDQISLTWVNFGKGRDDGTVNETWSRDDGETIVIIFPDEPEEEYEFETFDGYDGWFEINNTTDPTSIERSVQSA